MDRSIPASERSGYTISLSNFGMFAGRYATPVVVPPCVAIVAAGRGRHQITPVIGGFESHKVIPLSLTFDHRACTGGEAARFLKAMLDDLALRSEAHTSELQSLIRIANAVFCCINNIS